MSRLGTALGSGSAARPLQPFLRTKTFDPDGATKRALEAFAERLWGATNLPELLRIMSLGRASFYNAFGSKHELFVQTLDLYFQTLGEHFGPLISREPTCKPILDKCRASEALMPVPTLSHCGTSSG
jgi:hypothetical protein